MAESGEALCHAVEDNDLAEIRRLLESGATWERRQGQDPHKRTALSLAAQRNYPDIARLLLAHGANPDGGALHTAITHQSAETAIVIIESGANVHQSVNIERRLPFYDRRVKITNYLLLALSEKLPQVALALIEHGADVHERDVLLLAAYRGYVAVVEALLPIAPST